MIAGIVARIRALVRRLRCEHPGAWTLDPEIRLVKGGRFSERTYTCPGCGKTRTKWIPIWPPAMTRRTP